MIDVLIFLITTNLMRVPETTMAIKSLINQACGRTSISNATTTTAATIEVLYIIAGLSEQQEAISEK
jgi:hypothetical protein